MKMSSKRQYPLSWLALLSLMSAFSALSTDMYLPALPQMALEYDVSTHALGNTLGAYFLGLAFGQLIYGPLSDRYGRKGPLLAGLSIYILASFLCAIAQSHGEFLMYRVIQALGGCAGVVIARAAIRDVLDLNASAQALSIMMLIMSLAPIIAPAMGTLLIQFFAWNSIFYFLTMVGVITMLLVQFFFKETLVKEQRQQVAFMQVMHNYVALLFQAKFAIPLLSGSLFYALIYCYLSTSPDIFINQLGLSEATFSALFALNAFSLMLFSFINSRLLKRYSLQPLLILGCCIQVFGVLLISISSLAETPSLYLLSTGIFIMIGGLGFTGPNTIALVMQSQSQNIGLASAMVGSVQFFFGFTVTTLLSFMPFATLVNMTLMMIACLLLAATIQFLGYWLKPRST